MASISGRSVWVLVIVSLLFHSMVSAQKGKKTTKTSKKNSYPSLVRQNVPAPTVVVDLTTKEPNEWEGVPRPKPTDSPNKYADKMQDGTRIGQESQGTEDVQQSQPLPQPRGEIQQIPQQTEDIQQIPQQTEDIQQIPQQSEDIQQIPQQNEDIQQIPQQTEDIQPIPQQTEDIQQIPQQTEDIQQIPQQNEDIQQIPQRTEDIQQITQQDEDIQQIPQQTEDIQQIPQQTEDIQQIPQQTEDIQQIPQQIEDIQQIPQETDDIQQIPQQTEDIQQIPQHTEDIQQIPQQIEDIQQIPQETEDIQQIPEQTKDIQQIPQQTDDIQQQNEDIQQTPQERQDQLDIEFMPNDQQRERSERMRQMEKSWQDIPAGRITSNDIRGTRSSGVCSAWGPHHYRTFAGRHYNYGGLCSYVLAQDCTPTTKKGAAKWEDKYAVILEHNPNCHEKETYGYAPRTSCSSPYSAVHLQLSENRFVLKFPGVGNNDQLEKEGEPINSGFRIFQEDRELAIPFVNENVKIYPSQRYLVAKTSKGLIIRLDFEGTAVSVMLPTGYTGTTCGLCGTNGAVLTSEDFISPDGSTILDAKAFGNSWAEIGPDDICSDVAAEAPSCSLDSKKNRKSTERSAEKCFPLFAAEFAACHNILDAYVYFETCQMDCCQKKNKANCECSSMAEYFRECQKLGGKMPRGWRSDAVCPLGCKNDTIYSECVSPSIRTCKNPSPTFSTEECVDGCECPSDMVAYKNRCIPRALCPCEMRGQEYASGQRILEDCNTCECQGGQWECTTKVCPARCVLSGHHHITTFDGLSYQIPESCSFALYYSEKYVIEIENVPCRGGSAAIKNGKTNYGIKTAASTAGVCSRNLVLVINDASRTHYLKIKRFLEITIDGEEINFLPTKIGDVFIRQLSSLYLQVQLPNGINIVWNGETGGYIEVPPSFFGKTDGLCGTYTHNQADDFYTPQGDTELTVAAFARRWRTQDSCQVPAEVEDAPCDKNPYHRVPAEQLCEAIRSNAFTQCHEVVDPEPYYQACVYEICACKGRLETCLCPQLEQYALTCASKGLLVNWRPEIPECGIHCTGGQVYQMCVKSCDYSCAALSIQRNCTDLHCGVDGCACQPGFSLSSEGRCVPKSHCPCVHNGKEYPAGFKQQRAGKTCVCNNGNFECKHESGVTEAPDQLRTCYENQESIECMSDCPTTCENMNNRPKCKTQTCRSGCQCKKGYVLDTIQGKCIRPEQCPCHHGGVSYKDGTEVKMDCNDCLCKGGQWVCSQEECFGQCTIYGSTHYQTFDGKLYDFEGNCQYVLTKGNTINGERFAVFIQNVPCGTSDSICSKEVTFTIGSETVTLCKEAPYPTSDRFEIVEAGLFIYLYTPEGIDILWDKKSRVYLRVDPIHKSNLQGLCGNFDGDASNDFRLPSGGLPETHVNVFADSWKVHDYCPISQETTDICGDDSSHRQWAVHQCNVLKSELFQDCHDQVPVKLYYERCIADTCTCESGGNCDCLCTAISVYADICAAKGTPITWRSQNLCPIQCEECDNYNPCISLCPKETCLSRQTKGIQSCKRPCVEGCDAKQCDSGFISNSTTDLVCVPKNQCEPPKWECAIEGKIYEDGAWISEATLKKPCETCHCQKGRADCKETVCERIEILSEVKTETEEVVVHKCDIYGWSEWMNSYHPEENGDGDFEELINQYSKLYTNFDVPCSGLNMTSIECRPVKSTKKGSNRYSDDVTCSLPEGLVCRNGLGKGGKVCQDYEIRVFCDCESEKVIETTTTTTTLAPTTTTTTLAPTTTTTTPAPTTTESTTTTTTTQIPIVTEIEFPKECQHGWSEWVSTTNAKKNKDGDKETVKDVILLTQSCDANHVRNIECRVANSNEPWYDAGQRGITCDLANGLICLHGKQPKGKKCYNYEVRVYCLCQTTTSTTTTTLAPTTTESPCPPGLRWSPCLFRCDQTCHSYQDKLVMTGTCNMDQAPHQCVPGCEYVECNQPGYAQLDEHTCVRSEDCTCVLPDGSILPPGTILQKDCKKCHCVNNKLKCVDIERCGWTTAHAQIIATTCPPPSTPLCDEGYKVVEDKNEACLTYKCIPDCPPGLEWYDCHPRCEKSCINRKRNCAEGCVSGCFCPPGKIRNVDQCVEQNECPDRVCQGFGDPQVVTFDGAMFNFQGKGTFIMANHLESTLVISGHTDYCQGRVACIVGMAVEYQGHKVDIRRNQNVVLDDYAVNLERLPVDIAGMTVLGYPGHNYMVVIPELSAQIYYFSSHAAFSIRVPVALFFNRTKGLCGNCNFADDDDEMDVNKDGIPDRKDILCSWMSEGSFTDCMNDNEQQVPVNFEDNPYDCVEFHHPILQECVSLVDPEPFRRSCLYDVLNGAIPKEAACKSLLEFTRQCCEANAPVLDWMDKLGCSVPCPEGSKFIQCHDACPQTCTNQTTTQDVGDQYERLSNVEQKGSIKGSSTKGGKTSPIKIRENQFKCHETKMDGCFCPEGQVFHRGKCMTNNICDTCDDEGHKPGDSWKEGKCTDCHCDYNLKVVCLTPTCPTPPICRSEEMMRVLPNATAESCCTVYKCELKPKPTCPPAAVPTCAPGEIAKMKTGKEICPHYICECDPGLCPMVRWPTNLEPGQQVELVNVLCCSQAEIVCHKESCPVPPVCAPGLELKSLPGECCNSYKCKPPEDVCVYTNQLRIVDGAEYPVTAEDQRPNLYRPGESWNDGICRNCTCEGADGNYSPKCTLEQCPNIDDMPDKKDYILSEVPIPDQCCPLIARLFCKDNDGNIHEVGSEWKNPDNNCLSYRCEISQFGDVQKVERAIVCTECPESTEYVIPPAVLGLCCGWCRPIVCEETGETYPVGSVWNSTVHKCYRAECVLDGGSVRTIYTSPKCNAVPEECPIQHVVWDETGCCQKCNITPNKCIPALVNETETIGFLTIKDPKLGVCQNYKKVPGLMECAGSCDSHSKYSMDAGVFQSNCHCCSPNSFEIIEVELECAKGRNIKRKFQQPTSCTCNPCTGEKSRADKQIDKSSKGGRFEQQTPFGQETIGNQEFDGQTQQQTGDFVFPEHNSQTRSNFDFAQHQGLYEQEPFGQHPSEFGQEPIGQHPSEFGQEPIGQHPSEFGQEPIGQHPSEFGQEPIGQHPSEFSQEPIGQHPSEFGQEPIGQHPSEFGQEPIGQHPSEFGQEPIGQHPSEFGQAPIGQHSSEFGQHQSSIGQHQSSIGQHQSSIGQHPSSFGQQPSSFGQHQSSVGQHQSSFGQQQSSFNQQPSSFGQQPSEFGQSPFEGETVHHSSFEQLPNGYRKSSSTQTSGRNSFSHNFSSQSKPQGSATDANSEWARQLAEHQKQVEEMMRIQNQHQQRAQDQHREQLERFHQNQA